MELVRVRLRGVYAILAGAILLVALPLYQGSVLVPLGYAAAIQPAAVRHDFGPFLSWLSAHEVADQIAQGLALAAFLLALPLPGSLRRVLWPNKRPAAYVMTVCGRAGFVLNALGSLIALVTAAGFATAYSSATSDASRAVVAENFSSAFVAETLVARVIGGCCLAVFVGLVSARALRVRAMPTILAIYGIAVAALEAGTALLLARSPSSPDVGTSTYTVLGFALWLVIAGLSLLRLRQLPAIVTARPAPVNTQSPA